MTFFTKSSKTLTLAALAALVLASQASAAPANSGSAPEPVAKLVAVQESGSAAKVFEDFQKMLKKTGQLPAAFNYLKAHIKKVSPYQASLMVLYLENAIKKEQPAMDKRFFADAIQTAIGKVYKPGYSITDVLNRTKDNKLKALLKEAASSGYKLETAEGMFFTFVDYKSLQPFAKDVNADIKAYIDIMTVETEKAKLKDAALVIGYQELVNRALAAEKFVSSYPNSNRTAQIKQLLAEYKSLTYYGANNTPLFDYDSKKIHPNAKLGYTNMITWNNPASSEYLTLLKKFMDLLANNDYKLTAEVEKFRKANIINQ
ncbi:hypothetical protein [Paenibacillus nasutitermitis]|uniref:Uncharacterized protein n=1 Tax=Paenibacillus nasutitermitis TaxID=1652958 RepID=A0A916YXS0_9BACL|nr:hypothetical protein [Paenibacillus nasutitermitis]GGD66631.1 hypothetical protein GCM10010911_25480 [Paenibacillus nasutitermitis]